MGLEPQQERDQEEAASEKAMFATVLSAMTRPGHAAGNVNKSRSATMQPSSTEAKAKI